MHGKTTKKKKNMGFIRQYLFIRLWCLDLCRVLLKILQKHRKPEAIVAP
jgi:hypothetical protein